MARAHRESVRPAQHGKVGRQLEWKRHRGRFRCSLDDAEELASGQTLACQGLSIRYAKCCREWSRLLMYIDTISLRASRKCAIVRKRLSNRNQPARHWQDKAVGSALLGTALGATFGAAVGNRQGAAIFGSTGAIAGTAAGTASAGAAQMSIQEEYNNSYTQSMYSRGNQVPGTVAEQQSPPPVAGNPLAAQSAAYAPPSAAPSYPHAADAQAAPMTTRRAQVLLNDAGYPVGDPDGVFGLRSRQQLKKYQADNDLPATGELDPQTAAALNR